MDPAFPSGQLPEKDPGLVSQGRSDGADLEAAQAVQWVISKIESGLTRVFAIRVEVRQTEPDVALSEDTKTCLDHLDLAGLIDDILQQTKSLGHEGDWVHVACARFGSHVIVLVDQDSRFDWILPAVRKRLREAVAERGGELDPAETQLVDFTRAKKLVFFDQELLVTIERSGKPRVTSRRLRRPTLRNSKEKPTRWRFRPKLPRFKVKAPSWKISRPPMAASYWVIGAMILFVILGGAVSWWLGSPTEANKAASTTPAGANSSESNIEATRHGFLRRVLQLDGTSKPAKYVVFIPRDYDYGGTRLYPTIFFLHEYGSKGQDGFKHVQSALGPAVTARQKTFPFITIFPQGKDGTWRPDSDDVQLALSVLADAEKDFYVDKKRVYLVGQGYGASAVWDFAIKYPDRWAAIVPISAYRVPAGVRTIASIPCWCFQAVNDGGASRIDRLKANLESLKSAGAKPRLTELQGTGDFNFITDQVFAMEELYQWLLQQKVP